MYLSDYAVENRWGTLLVSNNDTESVHRPDLGRHIDGKGLKEVMDRRCRQPAAMLVIRMLIHGTGGVMLMKFVATGMDDQGSLHIQHRQRHHHW
jgi:hypothetical protein